MKRRTFWPRCPLTGILLIALIVVGLVEFTWRDMPPFMGWKHASRIGNIVTTLALAYVAAYMFHLIGDLWNRKEEHKDVQLRIEGNIFGLFESFRLLGKGMEEQLDRMEQVPFNFVIGDDTLLSYDWDKMLSKEDFAAHLIAQRMCRRVYYKFMEHFTELENDQMHLTGRILVQLQDIKTLVVRVKEAVESPRTIVSEQTSQQSWYMNHVGDKINELHAEMYFFKKYLIDTWKSKHPLLHALLAIRDPHQEHA